VAEVAKERLKSPRARLFVALDLPEGVRDQLAAWQSRALRDPALRPMRPEALHVTLCFLSYHPEKAIPRIEEVVASVSPRPVELRFDAELSPVPKGRPRLYALGAASDAAVALQGELSDALEAERFYEPEKRAFWPHVTVARVRSERLPPGRGERRGRGRPRRVEKAPGALSRKLREPFGGVRVALYRSNLRPQGAEYVRLGGVDLPSLEGQKR
jgi:2'-5' RNA ligase